MTLVLVGKSCATCQHWDGDKHCALRGGPSGTRLIVGAILNPDSVVCARHEEKERE